VRGMCWMVITGLCFLAVTVTVRFAGERIPAPQAAFIRYVFGALLVLPVLWRMVNDKAAIANWKLTLFRGVIHSGGVLLWFFAVTRISIAQVTALGYLMPVIATLLAALILGEVLHIRRIVAVVAGFAGVLIILRPGFSEVGVGQLAQLGAAPLFALSMILAKKLTGTDESMVIVAALTVVCALTLAVPALLQWVEPSSAELMLLALTAVFATCGHYAMTRALKLAPVSALQPVAFLQLVWATIAGVLLFQEALDFYVLLGGAVLVLSASYIAHREAMLERTSLQPVKGRGCADATVIQANRSD